MSDQDRISPYNNNTTSSRHMTRLQKNNNKGIMSWPIPNFRNKDGKNCMADNKEIY